MVADSLLTRLRLPLHWHEFDLPNPLATGTTVLTTGDPAWGWEGAMPGLGIPRCEPVAGEPEPGWNLDHLVVLVPDLDTATAALGDTGLSPSLRVRSGGRPAAFYRVGPVIEVIESPVRAPALFGVTLTTEEPLEVLALRWRSMGHRIEDPRPAMQPGRRILTVHDTEAGLAVMSPDGDVPG